MKKWTLVTGGAGFIGSHVADELIDMGQNVVILDDLSGGFIENVNKNSIFIKGSVTNAKLISELFEEYHFEYVYHLAAYAAEGLSHFIRKYNYETNLVGTVNLINNSVIQKTKCFIFTSSIAVYGENQTPMIETLTPSPEDPYGVSKYAVELDLRAANKLFGLNYIVFRPHNVYGERQNIGDKYRNVIGIFMNNLLEDKELIIFGNGEQRRAFSHISDVAPIIAHSVEFSNAYNEVFNVGADTPYSVNELVAVIADAMNIANPKVRHDPPRVEVLNAFSSHEKVRKYFNIKRKPLTIIEGIAQMSDWVKKHGSRKTKKFRHIEVFEKLPESWS